MTQSRLVQCPCWALFVFACLQLVCCSSGGGGPTGLASPGSTPGPNPQGPDLIFQTQPGQSQVGQPIAALQIAIVDSSSRVDISATDPITISLEPNQSPARLSGTLTVNALHGVATFSDLTLDEVGTAFVLRAMGAGYVSFSGSFDVIGQTSGLPEGNNGIAANYPGDVGIAADPAVVFSDDFEGYASAAGLTSKWDAAYHNLRVASEPGNVFRGAQALEFTVPRQSAELSNTLAKRLTQERDALFLRYYSKFDGAFDVTGSSHNGGSISAHYYVNGRATPGVPANGLNKFLASFENWRGQATTPNPGELNVYLYHPEQRSQWGDHFFPTGTILPFSSTPHNFGSGFTARPDVVPDLDRWYCYEFMVKANTVGQRDGRIACWLDGALIADFPGLRLRDVDTLKIDRFAISLHIGSNTVSQAKKWYDNVVAATSYIGPVS